VLETNNQEQLIFKHAISTVVIVRSIHHAPPSPPPPPASASGPASES
jgi:sRNA-binding regulator protein Hfq